MVPSGDASIDGLARIASEPSLMTSMLVLIALRSLRSGEAGVGVPAQVAPNDAEHSARSPDDDNKHDEDDGGRRVRKPPVGAARASRRGRVSERTSVRATTRRVGATDPHLR